MGIFNRFFGKKTPQPHNEKDSQQPMRDYVNQLASDNTQDRRMAALHLGNMRYEAKDAVWPLTNALKDGDIEVRLNAAKAICLIGTGNIQTAANALFEIGERAIPTMVEIIESGGNDARTFVGITLGKVRKSKEEGRSADNAPIISNTTCRNCGATISPSTFSSCGGLCVPCARGPETAEKRRLIRLSQENTPQKSEAGSLVEDNCAADAAASPAQVRVCVFCGAICPESAIQCERCGKGVFSSPKLTRESRKQPGLEEARNITSKQTISTDAYRRFFIDLGMSLHTTDPDVVYRRHSAYCEKCGLQFTREALDMLCTLGPGGMFNGARTVVMGATKEGDALRSGRCPRCGHTRITVVVGEMAPSRIYAPKGVYCISCQSRYSIEECIEPDVPEGNTITFICPKCKVTRAYNPYTDQGM